MFTKSTSNEIIDSVHIEKESYFHKFQFSYVIRKFHVGLKCRPTVTLQLTKHLRLWPEFLKFYPPDPKSWIRH